MTLILVSSSNEALFASNACLTYHSCLCCLCSDDSSTSEEEDGEAVFALGPSQHSLTDWTTVDFSIVRDRAASKVSHADLQLS